MYSVTLNLFVSSDRLLVSYNKEQQRILLYLLTQIRFPIGGERVTCHLSWVKTKKLTL